MKIQQTFALTLLFAVTFAMTGNADVISDIYDRELPDSLLAGLDDHFPGNGHIDKMDPSMLTADANVRLNERSTVSLSFVDEQAGFYNQVGYFTFDNQGQLLDQSAVFSNYSEVDGGGTLTPGDTIDIGPFDAGTNIGFYLLVNGDPFKDPHYTLDSLNPGQENYTAFYTDEASGYGVLGFEDLPEKQEWGLGYDDAIVGVNVQYIPEPATGVVMTLGGLVILARRRRRK